MLAKVTISLHEPGLQDLNVNNFSQIFVIINSKFLNDDF